MRLKTLSPAGSYSLSVPSNIAEEIDGHSISLWVPRDETLLQISSRRREDGDQVGAHERLRARLQIRPLINVHAESLQIEGCPDVAAARADDDDKSRWLFVYAVWPDLSVFLTISHPEALPIRPSWAMEAVRSLRHA